MSRTKPRPRGARARQQVEAMPLASPSCFRWTIPRPGLTQRGNRPAPLRLQQSKDIVENREFIGRSAFRLALELARRIDRPSKWTMRRKINFVPRSLAAKGLAPPPARPAQVPEIKAAAEAPAGEPPSWSQRSRWPWASLADGPASPRRRTSEHEASLGRHLGS